MVLDKIKVIITDKQKEIRIPTGIRMLIRRCCNAVLKMEDFQGSADVSVLIVDNEYIQKLNKKHIGVDAPTDVLSFPMDSSDPATGVRMLGDIVISIEKILEQSERYGHSLQREIAYLVAHGMLHLLGYDHKKSNMEKLRMREKEENVMNLLGLPCTYAYTMET
jgi:probable rRNA maturation factor